LLPDHCKTNAGARRPTRHSLPRATWPVQDSEIGSDPAERITERRGKMKTEDIPIPNPDCPLCSHPQRVAAASMRELQASYEEIAVALQLDAGDVERHFTSCVKVISLNPEEVGTVEGSDQQLQILLVNAGELYHSSVLSGNYVSASSSLAVRLRCLAEIGRRAETRAKHQELLVGADPCDPSTWPREVGDFINLYLDSILSRLAEAKNREVEA
jgi:hypothetical protein